MPDGSSDLGFPILLPDRDTHALRQRIFNLDEPFCHPAIAGPFKVLKIMDRFNRDVIDHKPIPIHRRIGDVFKLDRDPAMGASVMITAVTDSGGFFIFLGLATLFLL